MSDWTLDRICSQTTNPETLNALHACRPGHPLNNPFQWRNAYALATQRQGYFEIERAAVEWLAEQANKEED
jgi:hypothetical protein